MNNEREATAYHEAGHVVMFIFLTRTFDVVTILPSDFWKGIVIGPARSPDTFQDLEINMDYNTMIEEVMLCLSGPIAEEIYRGIRPESGFESDYAQLSDFVLRLIVDEREQELFFDWIEFRVKGILTAKWKAVQAIAEALLEKESLTKKNVFEILMAAQT